MGHTRWATHGAPTDRNAHPHLDCTGRVAVIHNGIIENFQELRARLEKAGHTFASETDTECIAHLIEEKLRERPDACSPTPCARPCASWRAPTRSWSAPRTSPGSLVGVKVSSPLVVGLGDGETLLASDIPAVLDRTHDGDPAGRGPGRRDHAPTGATFTDFAGAPLRARAHPRRLGRRARRRSRGFDDFMLQGDPRAARRHPRHARRAAPIGGRLTLDELHVSDDVLREVNKVFVVACGTAFHSGLVAKYAIEHWTRLPVEIEIASEFRYRDPVLGPDTLTLARVAVGRDDRHARGRAPRAPPGLAGHRGHQHRGLLARARGRRHPLHARRPRDRRRGHEDVRDPDGRAVPGRAVPRADPRLDVPRGDRRGRSRELHALPGQVERAIGLDAAVRALAERYADARDVLFIGRHTGYPAALEGALKLKEISYIHAEGFPAGELKHGPIALVEEGVPVVAIATECHVYPKMLSQHPGGAGARGAAVIAVVTEGDTEVPALADHVLEVPPTPGAARTRRR